MFINWKQICKRGVVQEMTGYLRVLSVMLIIVLGVSVSTGSGANSPPAIESLTSDLSSPLKTGAIIIWTANASDPEGDEILYRYLIKGPRTQDKEEVVKEWNKSRIWTWDVQEKDLGHSEIIVEVCDESHKGAPDLPRLSEKFEISGEQRAFLDVELQNDVYSQLDPRMYYCDEAGHRSFKNIIYLAGPDLDQVARVKYILDPSFSPNEFISEDASNNFAIETMAWGRFFLSAVVTDKNGQEFPKELAFQFKQKVLDAQSRGIQMISNC